MAASATPSSRDYKLNLSSAQLEQHVGVPGQVMLAVHFFSRIVSPVVVCGSRA